MRCPHCGEECIEGYVSASYDGYETQTLLSLHWYPENEEPGCKVNLKTRGKAYYCYECMQVFAVFEEAPEKYSKF